MQRILTPHDDFLTGIKRELSNIPVRNVYDFLNGCTTNAIQPIEIRPESFNFSLINGGNPIFAKIYNGSGIDRDMAGRFAGRAFPEFPNVLVAGSDHDQNKLPQEIVVKGLTEYDPSNAYLYASAEVFTRAVAHLAYPGMMQQPVALVDQKGEAVGFYLELEKDQEITSAQHVAKQDVAFFADPDTPTALVAVAAFKQSNDLSPQVDEAIKALRSINVLVY